MLLNNPWVTKCDLGSLLVFILCFINLQYINRMCKCLCKMYRYRYGYGDRYGDRHIDVAL